eukprot:3863284-Pleurochrysis_carterae.AAC.3
MARLGNRRNLSSPLLLPFSRSSLLASDVRLLRSARVYFNAGVLSLGDKLEWSLETAATILEKV